VTEVATDSTAKRGASAALATVLAQSHDVAIVDVDLTSRDVAHRLPVTGPTFPELARILHDDPAADFAATFGRDLSTRCLVVGAGTGREGVDSGAYGRVIEYLSTRVEHLVIDAPAALGTKSRPIDKRMELLDVVMVTTDLSLPQLRATTAYVSTLLRAQITGELPTWLDIHVVLTGDESDFNTNQSALDRVLRSLPVVARLPRLWGRNATNPIADDGTVHPDLAHLVATLTAEHRG
jgi:hypothetical protein